MFALGGCSHAALDQRINEKVAQESAINNRAELHTEAEKLIETAPGLNAEQRSGLLGLSKATRSQVDLIIATSIKLRSVLIKDLIATNYNEDEVETIKDRLRSLEDKRVSVLFDSIGQANTILGNDAQVHAAIIHAFIDGRSGSRQD